MAKALQDNRSLWFVPIIIFGGQRKILSTKAALRLLRVLRTLNRHTAQA